jgi:hypothetical protein
MMILATAKLESYTGRRLRERRVDEKRVALEARTETWNTNMPIINVNHGGGVTSPYTKPTEALVTVALPNGDVMQYGCRLPANKVTNSGVLATCLGDWARPFLEARFTPKRRFKAQLDIIDRAKLDLAAFQLEKLLESA